MKRFLVIAAVAILVLGLVALLLWWDLNRSLDRAYTPSGAGTIQSHRPSQASSAPTPAAPSPVPSLNGAYNANDPRWTWWNEQEKLDPKFEWKMPINFYGKAVDQEDQPVVGAKVIMTWTDLSESGSTTAEIFTDGLGAFALLGKEGKHLAIRDIVKEGYALSKRDSRFSFEYAAFFEKNFHQPDPEHPVVFRLRKKQESQPLVVRRTLYGISVNDTPNYIDLLTGKKTVGTDPIGDLAISVTRQSTTAQRFDWSVVFEGVDGSGFAEIKSDLNVEAPESGYVSRLEFRMNARDPRWRTALKKSFFVKSRGGQMYARIEADVMAKYNNQAAVDLQMYVNPTASRNLEYDPSK